MKDISRKPIRVLHVFMDGRIGGPPVRALAVAKGLRKFDIDSVFALPKGGDFKYLLTEEGLPFHEITCHGMKSPSRIVANVIWLVTFPITVFQLLRIIKKEKISIVHLNGLMAFQGGCAGLLTRRKVLWHLSSCLYPQGLVRILMPLIKAISSHMIIISEGIRAYHFGADATTDSRVSVVQECVDTSVLDLRTVEHEVIEEIRQRFCIHPTARIVGQVGNVNPIKGYEDFIRAAGKIAPLHPEVQFVIAGALLDTQKAYLAMLQELVEELGITEQVLFVGSIAMKELPAVLALFDVFLMTSHAEGGPRVTLEAMSMQLPVVSTNVGDVNYQIQDGEEGFVVEVKDWQQMADIANRLLSSAELSTRISTQARKKVVQHFDQALLVNKHRDLYRMLATDITQHVS